MPWTGPNFKTRYMTCLKQEGLYSNIGHQRRDSYWPSIYWFEDDYIKSSHSWFTLSNSFHKQHFSAVFLYRWIPPYALGLFSSHGKLTRHSFLKAVDDYVQSGTVIGLGTGAAREMALRLKPQRYPLRSHNERITHLKRNHFKRKFHLPTINFEVIPPRSLTAPP